VRKAAGEATCTTKVSSKHYRLSFRGEANFSRIITPLMVPGAWISAESCTHPYFAGTNFPHK
jgi:hypothetical protein